MFSRCSVVFGYSFVIKRLIVAVVAIAFGFSVYYILTFLWAVARAIP